MVEEFKLFGRTIEISDGRLMDIELHTQIRELAVTAQKVADDIYNRCKKIEIVLQEIGEFDQLFTAVYLNCSKILEELGARNVKPTDIKKKHRKRELIFDKEIQFIKKQYRSILFYEENNQEAKLRKLYNDRDTRERISDAILIDTYSLVEVLQEYIDYEDDENDIMTLDDLKESHNIFEILQKNRLNKEEAYQLAYQLFEVYPAYWRYYDWCIINFTEEMENLVDLAFYVGYYVSDKILEQGLKALFEKMPHSNEEETLLAKEKLEEVRQAVELEESETIKKVDEMLVKFDIEARTFHNILFKTREIRRKAESDFNLLSKMCDGVESFDEMTCNKKREEIIGLDFVKEIANIFLEKIEARKNDIWAAEDAVEIEKVFMSTNLNNDDSINKSILTIENIGRTNDKNKYIDALKGMNAKNREIYEKYYLWKEKNGIRKYSIEIVLIVIGIIVYSLDLGLFMLIAAIGVTGFNKYRNSERKKKWDLLTVNDTLIHPQLLTGVKMGDNVSTTNLILSDELVHCKSCNNEIQSSAKFCKYCGEKVI